MWVPVIPAGYYGNDRGASHPHHSRNICTKVYNQNIFMYSN